MFLLGGFPVILIITPISGKGIHFDEQIFQIGWNHHLVNSGIFTISVGQPDFVHQQGI